MAKRRARERGPANPSITGRPLLVVDPASKELRFLTRSEIPPAAPAHFLAMEPFTILGIDPSCSFDNATEIAAKRAVAWEQTIPDNVEYALEQASLRLATNILGDRQCYVQYLSFARQTYDRSRKSLSRYKIRRMFAHGVLARAPVLLKRQTIRNIQAGGIFGVSLLASLVLLLVVLTIPVGGVTILGFTVFATTLFTAWGPLAIMPIAALAALGGLAAFWYRKHHDILLDLQGCLGQVMEYMEAIACSAEDIFLLRSFRLFQLDSTEFRLDRRRIEQMRDAVLADFVKDYVGAFVNRLSSMISKAESGQRMMPERFFELLAAHPGEVRGCFERTLYELVVEKRANLLKIDSEKH